MGDRPLSTSLTNCLSVASARTCPSQWVISAKHGGKHYKPLHLSLYNACDPYAELRAKLYLCMSWAGFFLSCVNMLVWPWYWFYHHVIDRGFGREDRSWMFESVYAYVSAWEFQVCPTKGQLLVLLSPFCLSPFFFNMLNLNFFSLCARLAKRWGTPQCWQIDLSVRKFLFSYHLTFPGIMEMLTGSHGSSLTWDNRCHSSCPVGRCTPFYLRSCLCRPHVLTAPHCLTELFVLPVLHLVP